MSASPEEVEPIETMSDLLQRLGGIGPERILLRPPPGMATEADVITAYDAPRRRICELIDGVLVEKACEFWDAVLKVHLASRLHTFVHPPKRGLVLCSTGAIRLWDGRVRVPDVAFYSWERIPGRRIPKEPIPTLAPDFAIEVFSIGNTKREMALKREDYFTVGVRLVWEIDPRARTTAVYTESESPDSVLTESEILDASPVLPGFTVLLVELLAELDRPS